MYEFYSDIDAPNRMDEKPFLVVDLLNLEDGVSSSSASYRVPR